MDDVESHNVEYDAGTQSWFKALNQFSDMTKEEFKRDVIDGGSEKGCYKQKKKGNLRPPTARQTFDLFSDRTRCVCTATGTAWILIPAECSAVS